MVLQNALMEARWVDLDGPMHYIDHGGPAGAPTIVCVHGLGGSHANWSSLAPLLATRYRVLTPDLAGFGLTVGGPRSSTVTANRRLLDRFLTEVSRTPVILIGNSMGGLISALEAAGNPALVSHLILLDPALPVPLAWPDPQVTAIVAELLLPGRARRALQQRRSPRTSDQIAEDLLTLVCADPSRITAEVLQEHKDLARRRASDQHANRDFLVAAQSLRPFLGAGRRRFNALLHSIEAPVLLVHGDRDRLINIRAARRAAIANPAWSFVIARGIGHVPQLEAPEWTAEQVLRWLSAHPSQSRAA